ncbi:DUF502 domain-containing protein [Cytophagaceae bacterium ABcell3]|nr:DUF502 domain-containing protein [Cytophagaceae bacterium ABcell3]
MPKFLKYFLQGLLFVIPVSITIFIIYAAISWLDSLIPKIFDVELYPGMGLVLILGLITFIGYLASTLIAKPAFIVVENYLYKVPVINLIYSSVKDFTGAFVGEKKKFNIPVLVRINKDFDICRLGFLTQTDLKRLKLEDKVAVYFPHSYNISGNLTIVPKEHIILLDAQSSEVMKFIVSGGVSGLNY